MDLRTFIHAASEWGLDLIGSLTPSLIGSAAAQAWKPAMPWRQRVLQWVVGSTVSYYATLAIIAVTNWNTFVAQSIAFGIALLAFDATPKLARAAIDALASIPDRLADRLVPKKGVLASWIAIAVALFAFDGTPKFIGSLLDIVASVPGRIAAFINPGKD